MRKTFRAASAAVAIAALAATAACSSDTTDDAADTDLSSAVASEAVNDDTSEASDSPHGDHGVVVADAWIKATEESMTGVFGSIVNNGDNDIHIVGASSTFTTRTELHETVSDGDTMAMQQAQDGFRIPAGDRFDLEPGGHHIMLMDIDEPISAGQQVTITLELADGHTIDFAATGRSFAGGNEDYHGGGDDAESSDAHAESHDHDANDSHSDHG